MKAYGLINYFAAFLRNQTLTTTTWPTLTCMESLRKLLELFQIHQVYRSILTLWTPLWLSSSAPHLQALSRQISKKSMNSSRARRSCSLMASEPINSSIWISISKTSMKTLEYLTKYLLLCKSNKTCMRSRLTKWTKSDRCCRHWLSWTIKPLRKSPAAAPHPTGYLRIKTEATSKWISIFRWLGAGQRVSRGAKFDKSSAPWLQPSMNAHRKLPSSTTRSSMRRDKKIMNHCLMRKEIRTQPRSASYICAKK